MYGANATITRAPTDRLSYRVSGGYFNSDAFARPAGRIPVVADPREPGRMVGGASYPLDGAGAFGSAFGNRGTSQPKFDVRVDQELSDATLSYSGGVAGTQGLVHSGVGPFDIQEGSSLGYAKINYRRGDLRAQVFANLLDGDAPNLLLPDAATGQALQLGFKSQTFDAEIGHSTVLGGNHVLNYGGNVRRNTFDITIAPDAGDRLEVGAYLQDEIILDPFRIILGGRVDKFGNLSGPAFSPRLAFMIKARRRPLRDVVVQQGLPGAVHHQQLHGAEHRQPAGLQRPRGLPAGAAQAGHRAAARAAVSAGGPGPSAATYRSARSSGPVSRRNR